jgi:hypothetical protein
MAIEIIYLFIWLWLYGTLLDLGRFFSFIILYTVVGLLGLGISPSQDLYLHTEQHKQNERTEYRQPCLE